MHLKKNSSVFNGVKASKPCSGTKQKGNLIDIERFHLINVTVDSPFPLCRSPPSSICVCVCNLLLCFRGGAHLLPTPLLNTCKALLITHLMAVELVSGDLLMAEAFLHCDAGPCKARLCETLEAVVWESYFYSDA